MIHLNTFMPGSMFPVSQFLEKNSWWSFFLDNLDDERNWVRKYVEFDRSKRTLTFYSNDVRIIFFPGYLDKHWMTDWAHQQTSTSKLTFPKFFFPLLCMSINWCRYFIRVLFYISSHQAVCTCVSAWET